VGAPKGGSQLRSSVIENKSHIGMVGPLNFSSVIREKEVVSIRCSLIKQQGTIVNYKTYTTCLQVGYFKISADCVKR
jgi:hypothetical protein